MAEELPPLVAEIRGSASDLLSTLAQVESALSAFAGKDWQAQLGLDTTKALEELLAFEQVAQATSIVIPVTLDTSGALAQLAALGAAGQAISAAGGGGGGGGGGGIGGAGADQGWLAALLASAKTRVGAGAIAEMYGVTPQVADDAKKVAQLTEADLQSMESINQSINRAKNAAALSSIDAQLIAARTDKALSADTSIAGAAATLAAQGDKGGGGGGGGGGLLAALGFGSAASKGIFGIGAGLAGFGTIGAMAGLGPLEVLTTLLGIGGSAIGAGIGGAALGLGSLGVGAVGMGTDMAGIGQAVKDAQSYTQALDNLNKAIAVYGAGSTQAQHAQNALNYTLAGFPQAAQPAIVALSAAGQQFHQIFNQMTGVAEATGAAILTQLIGVADKFLPTIGKFAAENMKIIQASLQPLFTWLQGPGLQVFTQLEQTFQSHLPAAMNAFTQGIELIIRTLGFLAPYTGHFIDFLSNLLTKLNGPDWGKFTGEISHAIGIFHDWEGLVKAVAGAIHELFTHDAGTGTAIVVTLTNMINKFNEWMKGPGGNQVHALLEAHKQELLAILSILPQLISAFGQFDLIVSPVLMRVVGFLAQMVNLILSTPLVGQILAVGFAFEILGKHIGIIGALMNPLNNAIKGLAMDALVRLGGMLTGLGGPFAVLGGWLTNLGTTTPTAAEKAATAMQLAADSISASATQISEAMGAIDASAGTMATDVTAAATEAKVAMGTVGAGGAAGAAETAAGASGGVGAVGAAATGGTEAAVTAVGGSLATGALPVVAQVAAPVALVAGGIYGLAGSNLNPPGYNYSGKGAPPTAQSLGVLTQAQFNQQGGAQAFGMPYSQYFQGAATLPGGKLATGGPGYAGLGSPAPPTAAQIGAADYATNIDALSKATGLAQPNVIALANALKINLHNALDPGTIQQFTNYVKQQGGAATVTGQQWIAGSQNVQAALTAMSTKAQSAMPNVSGATRNMVMATQPALVDLVDKLNKSGKDGVGAFISQFLSGLTPAEMASKQMHDKVHSPLLPLEQELRSVGDISTANMIAAFIGKKGAAGNASSQLHNAINDPLYKLQTELATHGDIGGAGLVQDFLKHHPDAVTAAQAIHDGINKPLAQLELDAKAHGDTAVANMIAAFINNEGAADAGGQGVGAALDQGVAAGMNSNVSLVTTAAGNVVKQGLAAARGAAVAHSPSRLFADQVGLPIAQGIAAGIAENTYLVAKAAAAAVVAGVDAAMTSADWQALAAAVAAGGGPYLQALYLQQHPVPGITGYNVGIGGADVSNMTMEQIQQVLNSPPQLQAVAPGAIAPVGPTNTSGQYLTDKVIQLTSNTNIDGRTLASTVTTYQLKGARATGNIAGQYAGGTQSQTSTGVNVNAVPR